MRGHFLTRLTETDAAVTAAFLAYTGADLDGLEQKRTDYILALQAQAAVVRVMLEAHEQAEVVPFPRKLELAADRVGDALDRARTP